METIKQYRIRNCMVTVKRKNFYSRELVEAAAKSLKQQPHIGKGKLRRQLSLTSGGINTRDYLTRYRQSLKVIRENPTSYQVTVEIKIKEQEACHFLRTFSQPFKSKETFSTERISTRTSRDQIKSIVKNLENKLRHFRTERKRINVQDNTHRLPSSGIEIHIPVVRCMTTYADSYGLRFNYCVEPGRYLTAYRQGMSRVVFTNKNPVTNEKHVTVEIEFACKVNNKELGASLFEAGVGPYVTLKTDGSVREFGSGYIGHELVVCMPVSKRYEILSTVLDVINSAGAKVNKTCGLHVHLDMREYDHRKAFSNLVSAQKILYQMVPVSRRDNTYCKPTLNKSYDFYSRSSNRYLGINPQSYRKHGTIEIRLHSGTTDYTKITNFVDIVIGVGYNDAKIARGATSVSGFIKQHKLSKHLESYINSRIALFSVSNQEESA